LLRHLLLGDILWHGNCYWSYHWRDANSAFGGFGISFQGALNKF
jgi:hypothetical protein